MLSRDEHFVHEKTLVIFIQKVKIRGMKTVKKLGNFLYKVDLETAMSSTTVVYCKGDRAISVIVKGSY